MSFMDNPKTSMSTKNFFRNQKYGLRWCGKCKKNGKKPLARPQYLGFYFFKKKHISGVSCPILMILDSKWGFLRSRNWLVMVSCALHVPFTCQAHVFVHKFKFFLIKKTWFLRSGNWLVRVSCAPLKTYLESKITRETVFGTKVFYFLAFSTTSQPILLFLKFFWWTLKF